MIRGSKFAIKSGIRYGSIYGKLLQLAAEYMRNFVTNLLCRTAK
jgi:hypothetical protein